MTPMEELTEKAREELKTKMRIAHDNFIPLHERRCGKCALFGIDHEAEFIGLKDEDGSRLLNFMSEDAIVAMLWVNFNGCVTFKHKRMLKPGCFGAYGLPSCNTPGCAWFARCKQSREDC